MVLQMREMCLSKERLLSDSTPRFLTDDKELTEWPSSVRQCCRSVVLNSCPHEPLLCIFWMSLI